MKDRMGNDTGLERPTRKEKNEGPSSRCSYITFLGLEDPKTTIKVNN